MSTRIAEHRERLNDVARRRFEGSAAQDFARRLGQIHFVNTITVFGAAFMLSTLPLLILISSFASRRIEDDLSQHLGLDRRASHVVARLFETSSSGSASAVAFAVVLTMVGTLAVASCVQRAYEQIYRCRHVRSGNLLRLLVWSAALCGWLALDGLISTTTKGVPVHLAFDGLGVFLATTGFVWWSMRFLLVAQVGWRPLVPAAVATAVYWLGLQGFAALYFSSTINSDSRLYGVVGVVFSLLTWLIALAAVVVLGAVTGAVWNDRAARRDALVPVPVPAPPADDVAVTDVMPDS